MTAATGSAPLPEHMIVLVTIDDREAGMTIARAVVAERLAACVQLGGPVESVYCWQGKTEATSEWTLSIKTRGDCYALLERRLLALHHYEQPQILALPVVAGSAGYLDWVDGSTCVAAATGGAS